MIFGGIVTLGVVLAAMGALGLAAQSLMIRYGTVTTDSSAALAVVLLVNIAVLLPAAFILADPLGTLTPAALAAFMAAGLVGTMAGRAFHYESIKRIGSSRTEPVKSSQPLHASIIAILVLGEVVTPGHFLAMVLIVVGIALLTYEHRQSNDGIGDTGYAVLFIPLAAAFFYGIEPTFAKLGLAAGVSPLTGLLVKTASATLGFAGYLAWTGGLPRREDVAQSELPWLVAAGLANTVFLFGYYGALKLEPVSLVVPLVQSSPLLVIGLSMLFVRDELERVTWRLVAGACVVVAGAIGVTLLG